MRRGMRRLASGLILAFLLAIPGPAGGEPPAESTVSLAGDRPCEQQLLNPGSPGVAQSSWTAPARGYLTATLAGGKTPDWDLALFRASDGVAIAASTSFTSDERAGTWVHAGDAIAVQACRSSGGRSSPPLGLDFWRGEPETGAGERFALVSVTISGAGDVQRMEQRGLDVTHDVQPGSAQVATYSDEERDWLRHAGLDFFPVISDMAASDASDRAAEADAAAIGRASTLPSERETYRLYNDYTTELKALADANPGLVRSIEIGQTLEGRPIEGVEIATEVNRTDDGRPVFLNFGAHHAREWPSAEMPMEFALDLVERFNANDPRVVSLLGSVRVIIVPVVNVDGFLVSRNANGGAVAPIDDDSGSTAGQSFTDAGAYKRKNCRPTMGDGGAPCANRVSSGVDLNRNYGAYWGGPGSSTDTSSQSYRGTGPYSEPESAAVHDFTAKIHPTVFITNHTFTEGRWLRQPGFDAQFLDQALVPSYDDGCPANDADMGAITPDEAAMKSLGDAMAAASPGWISELGYETLCDITGATEDWNYFSQGTYGYTPELRGTNFHANYAQMVVAEYGDPAAPGAGVREAYLRAAERAANPADHGILRGNAPAGATLRLHKQFNTPTCESSACPAGNGAPIHDVLDTELTAPSDGTYEWHVNPSGRPLFPAEKYTMSCRVPGGPLVSRDVSVARGQVVTEDFGPNCALPGGGACGGDPADLVGSDSADKLTGTKGKDVIYAGRGNDTIKANGGNDTICGKGGKDRISGGGGADRIRGGGGADRIRGGRGKDRCKGGRGKDRISGCP